MKKSTKAWLVIGVVLVLVGVLGFTGVMSEQNWDFLAFDTVKNETRTYEFDESFTDIAIYSDTNDVAFLPSDGGKCRVVVSDNPKIEYTAAIADNTLTIRKKDTRKWFERFAIFSETSRVTVYLPQTAYRSLLIEEHTGDVEIPKDFTFESISIAANTGDISCLASASGQIAITTSTGDIALENLSAGKLALTVSTGRVTVTSVTCAEDLAITVSTGRTYLTDVSCRNLASTGDTGDMNLKNVLAAELMSIVRTTGDVDLDKCDAGELFIETNTGDVTGSLLSDKVFVVKSDTGRIDVPETTSGGKCKITTDTGDIKIRID